MQKNARAVGSRSSSKVRKTDKWNPDTTGTQPCWASRGSTALGRVEELAGPVPPETHYTDRPQDMRATSRQYPDRPHKSLPGPRTRNSLKRTEGGLSRERSRYFSTGSGGAQSMPALKRDVHNTLGADLADSAGSRLNRR
ncbi:unnamed protein product [Pleuronectes platessa]|uniref:Uncharacterized protein n=1 Tax=Pleuronectes platessa TaxID=8262 RepID=A0A9N7Z2E5_PLEPL|nr:unnamed protein product [Pleuronectes platessa]